jgi:hypothetical protein
LTHNMPPASSNDRESKITREILGAVVTATKGNVQRLKALQTLQEHPAQYRVAMSELLVHLLSFLKNEYMPPSYYERGREWEAKYGILQPSRRR